MFKFVLDNLFGVGAFLGLLISPMLAFEFATKLFHLTDRSRVTFLIGWVVVAVSFMTVGMIKQWLIDK